MTEQIERFMSYVIKTETCWLWSGSKNATGYGSFSMGGKSTRAHRTSHSLFKGPLISGLVICHTCDRRDCVNPDHLYQGTVQQNVRDMVERKRAYWFNKTHCLKGHAYEGDNLRFKKRKRYLGQSNERVCRTCDIASHKEYRARHRENPDGKIRRQCIVCRKKRLLLKSETNFTCYECRGPNEPED